MPTPATLLSKDSAVSQIAEIDNVLLQSLRRLWTDAKALGRPEEVTKWGKRLDDALDERLRHMAVRDRNPLP